MQGALVTFDLYGLFTLLNRSESESLQSDVIVTRVTSLLLHQFYQPFNQVFFQHFFSQGQTRTGPKI